MTRFGLMDVEWAVLEPLLTTDVHGVDRAHDRRVLNGIFLRLRTGVPWPDSRRVISPIRLTATGAGAGASATSWIDFWPLFQWLRGRSDNRGR